MLAVITPLITRGIIDNTTPDLTDLRLWCSDGKEPLHFRLQGNCLQDIAGCRTSFVSQAAANPGKEEPEILNLLRKDHQEIAIGDITLSRRAPEKNNRRHICNHLSIEFFHGVKDRILIETSAFSFDISLPQWQQTWEGENAQRMLNMEALHSHVLANVQSYRGPGLASLGNDIPPCDWDYRLNQAEAYMSIYPSIHEKYAPIPGGYLSAAYVLNRTDFLGEEALKEEKQLPTDMEKINKEWEVLDFMDKENAQAVKDGMSHPLFKASAQMTEAVQRIFINNEEKNVSRNNAAEFVQYYAGFITQLLATIILAQEGGKNTLRLAENRLQALHTRLETIILLCDKLLNNTGNIVHQQAGRLSQLMQQFLTSLQQ